MKKNYILNVFALICFFGLKAQIVLYEQISDTEEDLGVISHYVTNNSKGTYPTDDFVLTEESTIETIFIPGFYVSSETNISNVGTAISLFIYSDLDGVPSSIPANVGEGELEIRNLLFSNPSVSIEGNDFIIDIATANGSPVVLDAGTYWLVFVAHTPNLYETWNWYGSYSSNGQNGKMHDEGNYSSPMAGWINFIDMGMTVGSLAFRIEGSVTASVLDNKLAKVMIKPNPVKDFLNIKTNLGIKNIKIFSVLGKLVYSGNYANQIDVSNLEKGVYLLSIETDTKTFVKKIIKE